MTTTPEEQVDLDKAKVKIAQQQEMFFLMARDILRMDEAALRTIGQRTIEGALKSNVESTLKACDKIWKDHLKKYPD